MLHFNFTRIFKAKGIEKPASYLVHHGFSDNFASNVVNNRYRNLRLDDLQRLCELLNCTPNDLLQWIPDRSNSDTANHPLAPLLRTDKIMDLTRTLHSVPFTKLLEIEKLIQGEINKEQQ
jgi:DNA-binding Xre family transcriptional regulator